MGEGAEISLKQLDGIGPKTAQQLASLGLKTPADLLRYYPADYEMFMPPVPVKEVSPGGIHAVRGIIDTQPTVHGFGKDAIVSFKLRDASGSLRITRRTSREKIQAAARLKAVAISARISSISVICRAKW